MFGRRGCHPSIGQFGIVMVIPRIPKHPSCCLYKGQGHDHGMSASLTLTPSISLVRGAVGYVAEINHPEQC